VIVGNEFTVSADDPTSFVIGGRTIGGASRPYLIAEVSANHNGSFERALEIVESAAAAGADAVKMQTYTADTMTLDVKGPGFVIEDPTSPWKGRQLYELYQQAHTPWEWHKPLMERAARLGIACFSSAFDETAVDFLESLCVPAYKIASFECTDLPLIRRIAATGKPVIISTGMATTAEIDAAVRAAKDAGAGSVALLKCTSAYPASADSANVRAIPMMKQLFGCEVGLSDHTLGCGVALAAVALGASIVEKHLTLRRSDGGVDAQFSLEPEEFRALRVETERAWRGLGDARLGPTESEAGSRTLRRSVYVTKNLEAGDVLSEDNLKIIRPGYGLSPDCYRIALGRKIRHRVSAGTPLTWELIV